ncbi:hypothetical protein Fcan01_22926 [Folsomia candida]|uniref:Uncharacterized protein n=1 Tax=Folsomia candida TaxID=158441 RepID=A0A226DAZ7_FOLCA|nr:hypothetical protein Fcan01_22926 [Folsomia candida]
MEQPRYDGGEPIQIPKLSRVHPFAAVLDNNQDLVPNPILKCIRRTNLGLHIILLISAIAVITTYSIIWKETISPKLNLSETGNIWSFVLLFSTCGIVILVASFIIFRNVQGSQLKFKQGFRHLRTEDYLKCEATKQLKFIIYTMYIWMGEIVLVIILDFLFGLSNWGHVGESEMILAAKPGGGGVN